MSLKLLNVQTILYYCIRSCAVLIVLIFYKQPINNEINTEAIRTGTVYIISKALFCSMNKANITMKNVIVNSTRAIFSYVHFNQTEGNNKFMSLHRFIIYEITKSFSIYKGITMTKLC